MDSNAYITSQVAEMLNKAGFSHVHLAVGGMTQRVGNGLPVEKNAP